MLVRRLPRGVIVRRWDLDDEPAVLNPSAALLLDELSQPVGIDELTSGLDPSQASQVRAALDELTRRGIVWRS